MLGRRHAVSPAPVPVPRLLLRRAQVDGYLRINDRSKDLATPGIIKEDLVLAQRREVGSNLLHVHG